MPSLLKRATVLSFSRFANQAIVLLSPILLVRILSIGEYGSYREFMVYAGFVGSVVKFGIPHSLAYFLPKHPERENVWVTQASLFILAFSSVAIIAIFLVGDLIRANTSFDFVTALQLYVLFFINLDFVEFYWLGKKRTDYVFYYSSGRLLARVIVIITAASITKSAHSIVLSLVVLEAGRCLLVLAYGISCQWFTNAVSRRSLALQMSYFLPLGGGGLIEVFNSSVGLLFISAMLGAEALAFYAIGALATQIVNILRGAIADVIFPEILELRHANRKDALPLWQRATVWYCALLFPVAVLFSYYADAIVTTLFTEDYAAAIPVFSAFSFVLYLHCFDFHLPIRVQNANKYFVIGSAAALIVNVALLYPAYLYFGILGPAIVFFLSRLVMTIYLAACARKLYRVHIRDLVLWKDVGMILVASTLCIPVLIAGKFFVDHLALRAFIFGSAYLVAYLSVLRYLGVWDAFARIRMLLESRRRGQPTGKNV